MPTPSTLCLGRARSAAALALFVSWACLGLSGCGGTERGPYPIEPGRERERPLRPVPPGASVRERLPLADASEGEAQPQLTWTLPAGWEAEEPTGPRLASFRVPGPEGSESGDVSVSRASGGVLANLNRWRAKQMGLPAVGADALAALERRPLAGRPAVRVDLSGAYLAMGASAAKPGWRMLGLMQEGEGPTLFVKLVGPEALVEAQRAAFDAFAASLQPGAPPDPPSDAQQPPATAPRQGLDPSRLRWDLPAGWRTVKPHGSGMRVAEFRVDGAPEAQAVLSVLSGQGGGLKDNLALWRAQVGQGPLSEAELAALERLDMLGRQAVWMEASGHFQGMSGEDIPDALFVGVICLLDDAAVFVKLYGPRAAVEPLRAALRALCGSMKVGP